MTTIEVLADDGIDELYPHLDRGQRTDVRDAVSKGIFADWLEENDRPVDAACWRKFVDHGLVPTYVDENSRESQRMYGLRRWHWFRFVADYIDERADAYRIHWHTFASASQLEGPDFKPFSPHRTPVHAYLACVTHILRKYTAPDVVRRIDFITGQYDHG